MNKEYLLYNISKTIKHMTSFVNEKLNEHNIVDLVPSYVSILLCVYVNDGKIKMNEISKQVNKDKSTITVLVNRLVDRGYVVKEKCNLDRRVSYITLTKKALKLEEFFNEISEELNEVAFTDFTDEEKANFISLINRIDQNFENKNRA